MSADLFDRFWHAWPQWRRVKKKAAEKAFSKLKVSESILNQMIEAIEWQSKEWAKFDPRFTPHASTWLNNEQWTDERPVPKKRSAAPSVAMDPEWIRKWNETYGKERH